MKKIFGLALACCSTLFAQGVAQVPAVKADSAKAPVPVTTPAVDSVKAVAPAAIPVAAVVSDTAKVAVPAAAPAVDSAAVAVVDTAKAVEPVKPAEALPAADTAKVSEVAVDSAKTVDSTDAELVKTKRWNHYIGAGLSIPFDQYGIGNKKVNLINYGVNASYMGVCRCGFATKLSITSGIATTGNIEFYPSDGWQTGTYSAVEFGAGYSFVNSPKVTFSMFAVVGVEYAVFVTEEKSFKHKELGRVDRSYSESLTALTLGGDFMARFALSNHVGLFASVGGRWVAEVDSDASVKYKKGDFSRLEVNHDDDMGNFSIVPTVGVMWKF